MGPGRLCAGMTALAAWRTPLLLLLLGFVPILASVDRAVTFGSGTARFASNPVPIVVHAWAGVLFALLGALQFSSELRRRWPRWHRGAGVVSSLATLALALTGVWMVVGTDIPPSLQGPVLAAVRLLVAALTVFAVLRGWLAAVQHDFVTHQSWMTRAWALGLGAGTQVVVMLPLALAGRPPLGLPRDLAMTAAWVINWVVAEWLLRRTGVPRAAPVRVAAR